MAIYKALHRDYFAFQNPVADKDLATPPGSPAPGERYIVGDSATGVWSGHDGEIATYDGVSLAWDFAGPSEGWICYVLDEQLDYFFDGSGWIQKPVDVDESSIDHNALMNYEAERHRKITWNAGTKTIDIEI